MMAEVGNFYNWSNIKGSTFQIVGVAIEKSPINIIYSTVSRQDTTHNSAQDFIPPTTHPVHDNDDTWQLGAEGVRRTRDVGETL